jgi:O-acetyl-ADP-ribose deacetylase (regulator of RNase III)
MSCSSLRGAKQLEETAAAIREQSAAQRIETGLADIARAADVDRIVEHAVGMFRRVHRTDLRPPASTRRDGDRADHLRF